jgi:predicted nucleic acid-binding protein
MIAIDTNIWLYCHDSRDLRKQAVAKQLVQDSFPIILPWQVGCEFIAASRKLSAQGFTLDLAWKSLKSMRAMSEKIVFPTIEHWDRCKTLTGSGGFSFWDGLLVACCLDAGVQVLYSEDMGGIASINGMEIKNPFTFQE